MRLNSGRLRATGLLAFSAVLTALASSPSVAVSSQIPRRTAREDIARQRLAPVIVDGRRWRSDQMQRFMHTRLYVVALSQRQAENHWLAFTDRHVFTAYLHRQAAARRVRAHTSADVNATFYADAWGQGANFTLPDYTGQTDLFHENCWLWFCQNFNDRISSVTTRGDVAKLFLDINYGGGEMDLGTWGLYGLPSWWNDRASSIQVTPDFNCDYHGYCWQPTP